MLYFVEYLRAIAVLLITNSHFKGVYPTDILSFGGGLGLALFYMISGYLLTNINAKTAFLKWYPKKIIRMYVPLWIFQVVCLLTGYIKIESASDLITTFLFPSYWFVTSMVVIYAIYFFFIKYVYSKFAAKSVYIFIGLLLVSFAVLYITQSPVGTYAMNDWKSHKFSLETPYLIMQTIWLTSMLIGALLKKVEVTSKKYAFVYLIVAFLSVILFMAVKLCISKDVMLWTRFLLAVSYIAFAYSMFRFFMSNEKICQKLITTPIGKFFKIISKCSLEIYYVQFMLIALLNHLKFPVNFIVLCIAILISAYILHFVSEKILSIRRIKK